MIIAPAWILIVISYGPTKHPFATFSPPMTAEACLAAQKFVLEGFRAAPWADAHQFGSVQCFQTGVTP